MSAASAPLLRLAAAALGVLSGATACVWLQAEPRREADAGSMPREDAGGALVAPCPSFRGPPALGVVDARVDLSTTQRLLDWRDAMAAAQMREELDPAGARAALRIEQSQLADGCLSLDQVVDVGRGLFLRRFTREEGWGHAGASLSRVHQGAFGGPDALSCQDCHWKGGAAGAGDRADNSYLHGDGDDVASADVRNPPALWGAGWRELVAHEMSDELRAQAADAERAAAESGAPVARALRAKGVSFGRIRAMPVSGGGAALDYSEVEGVDPDLRIKPFGWKGTFATLREFIGASLQVHHGMQAEEVVAGHHAPGLALTPPSLPAPRSADAVGADPGVDPVLDPDRDGVVRELTEGQLSALVLYVATLDAPPFLAPHEGVYRKLELFSKEMEFIHTAEAALRWQEGFAQFQRIGCATCHVPFVPLRASVYRTTAALTNSTLAVDLSREGARPTPPTNDEGEWLVAAFSDFKRHDLGPALASLHEESGVATTLWMTRPLWGVAMTSPYLHTGAAMTLDAAIRSHGGEAEVPARNYRLLSEGERESLRFFLASLARAPAMRIR